MSEEPGYWQQMYLDEVRESNRRTARALKYEQALREIENTAINFSKGAIDSMMLIGMRMIEDTARAALDKPGGILQTSDVQCIPRPE